MDRKIQKFVLIPHTYWENFRDNRGKTVQKTTTFPTDGLFTAFKQGETNQTKAQSEKVDALGNSSNYTENANNLESFFGSKIGKDYYKKQILSLLLKGPSIKISNARTIIVNNVDTEIGVISFINAIRSQTKDITSLHETILKELNLPTSLITNKNVRQKREKWISFSF